MRNCPGKRILVLGNHDHDIEGLHDAGFDTMHVAAMYASDPPLALSHREVKRSLELVHPTRGEEPYAQITQISNENGVYWGFGVQMYADPSRNEPRGAGSAGSTAGSTGRN